jgi:hypothetical protein
MLLMLVSAGRWALAVDKLRVYTVNYPLAYFAERIGERREIGAERLRLNLDHLSRSYQQLALAEEPSDECPS